VNVVKVTKACSPEKTWTKTGSSYALWYGGYEFGDHFGYVVPHSIVEALSQLGSVSNDQQRAGVRTS
jgi:hypothetical protein